MSGYTHASTTLKKERRLNKLGTRFDKMHVYTMFNGKHKNGVNFWAPRHKHRNGHENSPGESWGPLNRTILHRISVRACLWWRFFFGLGSTFGARDINTEMVSEIVPVRAADLSIGQLCTEFRCERFCDDTVLKECDILVGKLTIGVGRACLVKQNCV